MKIAYALAAVVACFALCAPSNASAASISPSSESEIEVDVNCRVTEDGKLTRCELLSGATSSRASVWLASLIPDARLSPWPIPDHGQIIFRVIFELDTDEELRRSRPVPPPPPISLTPSAPRPGPNGEKPVDGLHCVIRAADDAVRDCGGIAQRGALRSSDRQVIYLPAFKTLAGVVVTLPASIPRTVEVEAKWKKLEEQYGHTLYIEQTSSSLRWSAKIWKLTSEAGAASYELFEYDCGRDRFRLLLSASANDTGIRHWRRTSPRPWQRPSEVFGDLKTRYVEACGP